MRSPGRPYPPRQVEQEFWRQIAEGLTSEAAAKAVGVSGPVGSRWFRHGGGMPPISLADGQDALVVAATRPSGRLATYSQYGEGVSVAAPGGEPTKNARGEDECSQATCITSVFPDRQYAVAAGTSMAAPQVAGLAALLIQQRPSRRREDVEQRITSTARPLDGAGAVGDPYGRARGDVPLSARATGGHVTPSAHARPDALAHAGAPAPVPLPPLTSAKGDIPLPVAGFAGGLVGLAAMGMLLAGLTRKA